VRILKPHAPGAESVSAGDVPLMSRPTSERLGNLPLTLPFLLLYWTDLAHHTLFFDELNAWAIAAASPTLPALFHLIHLGKEFFSARATEAFTASSPPGSHWARIPPGCSRSLTTA
jgi:hypothetical protein